LSAPSVLESLAGLRRQALDEARAASTADAIASLRVRVLGRKGDLTAILRGLKDLPPEARVAVGQEANRLKDDLEALLAERQDALDEAAETAAPGGLDVSLPGRRPWVGHRHVLTSIEDELVDVFHGLGFTVGEGPEVEDDFHNFTALNLPPGHPAREAHDTYYVSDSHVLRTHTSPCWVRAMEQSPPPLRMVFPGRVYRAEAIDASHSDQFHQIDGLYVETDRAVTLADLKSTLAEAARRIIGAKVKTRFRPSYFPFTEPSAEMDVTCIRCGGGGALAGGERCGVCKGSGWLELLGAGMVHPAVFEAVGYDPERTSGFAFGLGLDRMAILRHDLPDIRLLLENDLRFLGQFA
jgi:phenylalanyl-tRNA synthetase alpha chain